MEREIEIPLPEDGSLDVKLSTLYRLCPELFAAEITPLNDSTITLPLRIGATTGVPLKSSAQGFEIKGGDGSGHAFWSPLGAGPQAGNTGEGFLKENSTVASPAENAFSAGPVEAGKAPGAVPGFGGFPAGAEFKAPGGFDAPSEHGKNAFGAGPVPSPSPLASTPDGAAGFFGFQGKPQAKDESGGSEPKSPANPFESDQGFSTLFSKKAEQDLSIPHPQGGGGFTGAPAKTDSEGVWGAMFRGDLEEEEADEPVPFANIGQLLKEGAGQAKKPAPEVVQSPETVVFEPAFGFSEPPTSLSQSEVAPVELSTPKTPAHSVDPFAGFSAPKTPAPPVEPVAAVPVESEPVPGFEGFTAAPVDRKAETAPVLEEPKNEGSWSFDMPPIADEAAAGIPEIEVKAPVTVVPESAKVEPFEKEPSPGLVSSGIETPPPPAAKIEEPVPVPLAESQPPLPAPVESVPAEPVATPDAAFEEVKPVAEVAEAIASVAPGRQPSSPTASAPVSEEGDDERDLEFRAIFSTSEKFTLSMLARKIVGLPGIASCSLSTPGKLVQASRREENRLGNQAREMVETLRSLAKLTGLPEAKTFTLQTDRGIVSLFLEEDHCVCVNQEGSAFEPGVREKLILIARCMRRLQD